MRTRIQSDRTCVPPVTAERSPPDSRMTGADSPVIAASLTEATPSTTSPSRRDDVAGLDEHNVADLQAGAGHELELGPVLAVQQLGLGLGARLAQRVGLRLAAAFGDGFGEIGEQHGEPQPDDDLQREAEIAAAGDQIPQNRTVVSAETTATTNITGFLIRVRGFSFLKAPPTAGHNMRASMMLRIREWSIPVVEYRCCPGRYRSSDAEGRRGGRWPVARDDR